MSNEPDYANLKIRPPVRNRLRIEAARYGETYSETLSRLLDAVEAEPAPAAGRA